MRLASEVNVEASGVIAEVSEASIEELNLSLKLSDVRSFDEFDTFDASFGQSTGESVSGVSFAEAITEY